MLLLPDVSESIAALLKDCPIIRPCSPDDVMDPDHGPVVVEETDVKMPHPPPTCDCDGGRSGLSSSGQGSEKSLGRAPSSTGTDIYGATGEEREKVDATNEEPVDQAAPLRRGATKSRSERILMKSSSFLKKIKGGKKRTEPHALNAHSSHSTPGPLHGLKKNEKHLAPNSYHRSELTDLIQINGGNKRLSVSSVHHMLHSDEPDEIAPAVKREDGKWLFQDDTRRPNQRMSFSSTASSFNEGDQDMGPNELDVRPDPFKTAMDSSASRESLGDSPSLHEHELHELERVEECLSTQVSVLDRKRWDNIQEFSKLDLMIGQHLGRGSFSDVFEVIATIVKKDVFPSLEALSSDRTDLDKLIEEKFPHQVEDAPGKIVGGKGEDRAVNFLSCKETKESDLDVMVDALFIRGEDSEQPNQDKADEAPTWRPARIEPRSSKRHTIDLGRNSVCLGSINRPTYQKTKVTLAMKCLRPQVRSDADQFIIGVEDLVHETTVLASLDHPNIVKIHGRACGRDSASFRLSDGFFILLDKLTETLEDRIRRWKKLSYDKKAPHLSQINTAFSIADALSYLHSKKIVFCDLKPANVGFDSTGVLKLFDFGFATTLPDVDPGTDSEESHLLYDKCGTPRYMAPEVALELGYSLPADVYSLGILLWQICSLKKPFDGVKTADELHKAVFVKNGRPKIYKHFPQVLRDLMTSCWSVSVDDRPEMWQAKSILAAHAKELSTPRSNGQRSFAFRRTSWDK